MCGGRVQIDINNGKNISFRTNLLRLCLIRRTTLSFMVTFYLSLRLTPRNGSTLLKSKDTGTYGHCRTVHRTWSWCSHR